MHGRTHSLVVQADICDITVVAFPLEAQPYSWSYLNYELPPKKATGGGAICSTK